MKGTIQFEHVSKRYRLGTWGSLRGALSNWLSRPSERESDRRVLWALRDVSFALTPGASLGLIGPNGSGKTTTLKLLSKVTYPTAGKVVLNGRVSSLIELGAGFHPELTGRDNVFLNGAILGLTQREVARRLDAIIAFSELERFIDTPVKRYSSGMYVRLGFAVAAHVEPDILLVDEVLAVGDASFRQRCIQRMRELRANGTTLLFVSHNMHLVRAVCDSAVLLLGGQICAEGKPADVVAEYEKVLIGAGTPETAPSPLDREALELGSNLLLRSIEIMPSNAGGKSSLLGHLPATVCVHYKAIRPQHVGRVLFLLLREDGTVCCATESTHWPEAERELGQLSGEGVISVTYDPLQLTAGTYLAEVMITEPSDSLVIASAQSSPFQVLGIGPGQGTGVYIPRVSWERHAKAEAG
jgi:lipopolysaccharide transport system ATP-binding protein